MSMLRLLCEQGPYAGLAACRFDWHPVTKELYFGFLERDWQVGIRELTPLVLRLLGTACDVQKEGAGSMVPAYATLLACSWSAQSGQHCRLLSPV